jgi:hypothetical protein
VNRLWSTRSKNRSSDGRKEDARFVYVFRGLSSSCA